MILSATVSICTSMCTHPIIIDMYMEAVDTSSSSSSSSSRMAKVHPHPPPQASSSPSSSPPPPTQQREVFTIWMKSLVLNGNGCAVYNSKGRLAYRVDNYGCRRGDEAYLMDLAGKVLFRILRRKKLGMFGGWEGYRYTASQREEPDPSFRVKKPFKLFSRDAAAACDVTVFDVSGCRYRMEGLVCKSAYKITDAREGLVVAEVKRKQTAGGVVLGDDVLTLAVEPNSDLSVVMALVVVWGLISHTM